MEPPSRSRNSSRSSERFQRNMKERDRRRQMKELLAQLSSTIIPETAPKLSVPELVDEATDYVNKLHGRIAKLKQEKALYNEASSIDGQQAEETSNIIQGRSRLAEVDIKSWDSDLEVNLICGPNKKFMLHDVIHVLRDEAAEVTSITYHNVTNGNTIYIIKAQAIIPRIGVETSRIHQRLHELIHN